MKDQVIKVLDFNHGREVIQYWKDRGVDVREYEGNITECTGGTFIYYGVINGKFDNYDLNMVRHYNADIIELPNKLPIPRMVLVSDYDDEDLEFKWMERELLADLSEFNLNYPYVCRCVDDSKITNDWKYMKEIPQVEEMTLKQVCKELGREIKIIK